MKIKTSAETFDYKLVFYRDYCSFKRSEEKEALQKFNQLLNNPRKGYKHRMVTYSGYNRFFEIEWERNTTPEEIAKFEEEEKEYKKTAKQRKLKQVAAEAKKLGFKLVNK